MPPTSTMPSVFQVGTSSVGAPSPGRQAAILTNLPGWPDLHDRESADMLWNDISMILVSKLFWQQQEGCHDFCIFCCRTAKRYIYGRQDQSAVMVWCGTTRADGSRLKKLWYKPIACQSAALLHPVMVAVSMLTFRLPCLISCS